MSKVKEFLFKRKVKALKKSMHECSLPEQGSFVTLFNNSYKVLTKPDSEITILEDSRSNKMAYPRAAFSKMLKESSGDKVEKAGEHYGARPKTLVGEVGQNVKSSGGAKAASAAPAKAVDPVGTIRNGRKKIVSKRTGETMWVNIATGEGHQEHDSHAPQQASQDAEKQTKEFFDSTKDSLHPGDKMRLQRQMKDLMTLKQKTMNMLDMAHQDDRQKLPEGELTRKKVFSLQDQYKQAFEQFKTDIKASVERRKKENL